jgi:TPR repeat protein
VLYASTVLAETIEYFPDNKIEVLKRLARKGTISAIYDLKILGMQDNKEAIGVLVDLSIEGINNARVCLKELVKSDCIKDFFALGIIYEFGIAGEKSLEKALKFYLENLLNIDNESESVKNFEAIKRLARNKDDDGTAKYEIADLYYKGTKFTAKNKFSALAYYKIINNKHKQFKDIALVIERIYELQKKDPIRKTRAGFRKNKKIISLWIKRCLIIGLVCLIIFILVLVFIKFPEFRIWKLIKFPDSEFWKLIKF